MSEYLNKRLNSLKVFYSAAIHQRLHANIQSVKSVSPIEQVMRTIYYEIWNDPSTTNAATVHGYNLNHTKC